MYQVLYRKWRPRVFEDVAGQPQVTVTLKNELKARRINHAYLFTGSRGTGKTTCAKIMAKAVNCLNPIDGDPCGECEICRGIDNGSILDVAEIDAASNNGVDNIRTIIDESAFSPAKAKYRVYIIDEVHMLSAGAFNALLKTLEEPPSHVVFILATTEVHKLPATILSRCQRFDFHRIASGDIAQRLKFVAENENVQLDDDASLLIASVSDGALRDALSLLDRCMGISNNITADMVYKTAGLAGRGHLFSIADCVINRDSKQILHIIENLYNESKDMGRLCEELIEHFRNLMLIKTINNCDSLMVLSAQEKEQSKKQSDVMSLEDIVYVINVLQSASDKMFKGSNKRMELELALIKLSSAQLDTSSNALLTRIAKLERKIELLTNGDIPIRKSTNDTTPYIPSNTNKTSDLPVKDKPVQAEPNKNIQPKPSQPSRTKPNGYGDIYNNAVPMENWQDVLKVLKTYSVTTATSFKNTKAYISGDYILIDSQNQLAFNLLKQPSQRERMRNALKEVTGRTYKLGPYKKPEKQVEQSDPMDAFLDKVQKAGVNVEKE